MAVETIYKVRNGDTYPTVTQALIADTLLDPDVGVYLETYKMKELVAVLEDRFIITARSIKKEEECKENEAK